MENRNMWEKAHISDESINILPNFKRSPCRADQDQSTSDQFSDAGMPCDGDMAA
jgi:hypothetical protein